MILFFVVLTFLSVNSHNKPVPDKSKPITTKSDKLQLTESVNCIAINGISNSIIIIASIKNNLLFFIRLFFNCF